MEDKMEMSEWPSLCSPSPMMGTNTPVWLSPFNSRWQRVWMASPQCLAQCEPYNGHSVNMSWIQEWINENSNLYNHSKFPCSYIHYTFLFINKIMFFVLFSLKNLAHPHVSVHCTDNSLITKYFFYFTEATKGKVPWLKLESNMTSVGSPSLWLVHPLLHQPAWHSY